MATTRKEQREQARAERLAREQAERDRQRRNRRLWQLGGVLVLAAVIVVAAVAISSSSSKSSGGSAKGAPIEAAQVNALLAGIPQAGQTLGNPSAPVTINEFADLQCPFCRQYTITVQPSIIEKYVRTGKAKMVFQNLTFIGQDSVTAAQAAGAAALQNKLWNFADIWYHNQGEENSGYVNDAFITKIASGVPGLDTSKLMSDRNSGSVQQYVNGAASLAQQYNVTSTPTFLLQRAGRQPVVADMTTLQQGIDKALK